MYPCLLFCAKEKALDYMREAHRQLHADVFSMWNCLLCFCREPATLQQSQSQTVVSELFQELLSVGRQTFGPKVPQLVAKQGRKARSPFTYP